MGDDSAWQPDGDAPLVRRLTERNVSTLLVGVGLIGAAFAIVRQVIVYPESVQVPIWVAVIVIPLLVVLLGWFGVAIVVTFVRAPRHVVRVGPDGVLVGGRTLRLAWDDVATIRVRVDELENPGQRYPMPRRMRNSVFVHLVWRTTDGVEHRRLLAAPPFAAGTDLPLVRDLDAALMHFAPSRRRAPVGT